MTLIDDPENPGPPQTLVAIRHPDGNGGVDPKIGVRPDHVEEALAVPRGR